MPSTPSNETALARYRGHCVVIKCGGRMLTDPALQRSLGEDLMTLLDAGVRPVIVHGGGPQISELLNRLGHETRFANGLRVTDEAALEVVEMVLIGQMNPALVRHIQQAGGQAIGLSGYDGGLLQAEPLGPQPGPDGPVDCGHVGSISDVQPKILQALMAEQYLPVVAPLAPGADGHRYNINADWAASHLAVALGASCLLLLSDIPGVCDSGGAPIADLSCADIPQLAEKKVISGGMLPKLDCVIAACEGGVECWIGDGCTPHTGIKALCGETQGTWLRG